MLYAAEFLKDRNLLNQHHEWTFIVPDQGVAKILRQRYGPVDNFDLWTNIHSLLLDQEFDILIPSKGDPHKGQLDEVKAMAKSIHTNHIPSHVTPPPLSPSNHT